MTALAAVVWAVCSFAALGSLPWLFDRLGGGDPE